MKEIIAQDENVWVAGASAWLVQKQRALGAGSLYIPAGETPKAIYRDWQQRKPDFLNKLKLIQIDDVMTGSKTDHFKHFFQEQLPDFADRIEYIDNGDHQADLGILGIGLNGHVAFHEPGLALNFFSGCVRLQNETLKNLQLEPETWGKTYGLGAFMSCKALLLIVRGISKKSILEKTLRGDISLPSTQLLKHADLTVLTDFPL